LGTAYRRVDIAEATRRDITVCNTPGWCTQSVAEFTAAAIVADLRSLHHAAAAAAAGDFTEPSVAGRDLGALEVGVVGAGCTGARVARLIHLGFGSTTRYWSRNRKAELERDGIRYATLDDLLANSDVITLNMEHNSDTTHFIDERRVAQLKPGALVVCTVPLDVIAYAPLAAALSSGAIRLVFDHADEMDRALAAALTCLPNVTAYPRSATPRSNRRVAYTASW
jgi:lactate dehydrogenase-like 2-hydroxyacid dehydrogenase